MKIDFDHYKGAQIADTIQTNLNLDSQLMIIDRLKPAFSQDGNQYCYLYGELPNDCIVGFGETPYRAMVDFTNSFYNAKAIVFKPKTIEP